MNIGIFGGCFNPPHKAHIEISNKLLENKFVDKIIYVPVGSDYEKDGIINVEHRYNMLKILFKDNINITISDYEMKNGKTLTYHLLDYYKSLNPNDEIYYILGFDNLANFSTWGNYKYLLSTYKLLVINREGYNTIDEKIKDLTQNMIYTNISFPNISSSEIREKIKQNLDVSNMVSSDVLQYIKENKIYC